MKNINHKITTRVWVWQAEGSWHFLTIEKNHAMEIKKDWPWPKRGFGPFRFMQQLEKLHGKLLYSMTRKGSIFYP